VTQPLSRPLAPPARSSPEVGLLDARRSCAVEVPAAQVAAFEVAAAEVAASFRLPRRALAACVVFLAVAVLAGSLVGPARLGTRAIVLEMLDALPGISVRSGLDERQSVIFWQWRLPRVVLGGLVGASLSLAGASYQGVFRNPLVAPFSLGVVAGAGLGATVAIAFGLRVGVGPIDSIALLAFIGALAAVTLTSAIGARAGRSGSILLLAGVAVASFLTAIQTFVMQRRSETLREVYAWILGRLATSGWGDVVLLAPYVVGCGLILVLHRRHLDVLRLGEDEAHALGVDVRRVRWIVLVTASLLTAAAVAVSGIISFVGLVIPHTVRMLFGTSYRVVIPLSALLGAGFLMMADVLARSIVSPAELPIGVITAFVGAPFFAVILWRSRAVL
jgi:iron complex transport system permease protein